MIFILLIAGVCTLDIFLKNKVEEMPKDALPREIAGGRLTICRSHNSGLMMRLGEGRPLFVKLASAVGGLLCLLVYAPQFLKEGNHLIKLGGSLLLGGAASNLYDHFKRGYVVDYIKFPLQPIRKIAFNLGDLCIFAGWLLTFLSCLLPGRDS